jgi:hypothetical protein
VSITTKALIFIPALGKVFYLQLQDGVCQKTLPRAGIKIKALVVIDTDYTGRCISNYHEE